MPAKKKPVAKKPAKKAAAKKAPAKPRPKKVSTKPVEPVEPRSPKKPTPTPARKRSALKGLSEVAKPLILGEGSVSLVGPGRIRWTCYKLDGGVAVKFQPSGVRVDTRRLDLTLEFDSEPSGATSPDFAPRVDRRVVGLRFQTYPGWERGFQIEVQGVDHAPKVS